MSGPTTIDANEIAKFEAMAADWWDPEGKFKPLHRMNPVRLDYITRQIAAEFERDLKQTMPLSGLRILDIGCGGGLVAEPLARLGADVVGIDAAGGNIPVAAHHAAEQGLNIDYRHTSAEALGDQDEVFDAVLTLEIIEHVADPQAFLTAAKDLVRPGGLLICSTLNKTAKSYALAIVGAEYILGWLPKGTHDWSKFIPPKDLDSLMVAAGLDPVDQKGLIYNPIADTWHTRADDLSVNYIATALRPA